MSSFWIKGVYMLSIVATVLVCLPLLRLSFSALGTQGLAGVFFLQVRPKGKISETNN